MMRLDPIRLMAGVARAALPMLAAAMLAGASAAGAAQSLGSEPWVKMPVNPGSPVDMRPFPPRTGRDRCIDIQRMAGAQLFGDRAVELSMRDGRRWRLFLARECPALSFYQGFYYRRSRTGQLCAGRDVIGARSGGECPIVSIIPLRSSRR